MYSQSSSKINYMCMPTLKRLALVKIGSIVWNQRDVRDLFSEKYSSEDGVSKEDWKAIEVKVIKKVLELQLPIELGKNLSYYIHQAGFQIVEWMNFHILQYRYIAITELPRKFFWMPLGNIDYQKVAETLVNDKRLDSYTRFKLSCIYCLEKNINFLWHEVPKDIYKDQTVESIVQIWSAYLAEVIDHQEFLRLGFLKSLYTGCESGTRYFLTRFTSEHRNNILVEVRLYSIRYCYEAIHDINKICFPKDQFINTIFYLVSKMNEHQQTEYIRGFSCEIMLLLLNWPFQRFFLKTAKNVGSLLCPIHFFDIISLITSKMISETEDYGYQKMFSDLWQMNSVDNKQHVIKYGGLKKLLFNLFAVGDEENIKLLFKAATFQEKEDFIFCNEGQLICRHLIEAGSWKLLKFFIQECTLSKKVFQKLKEDLQKIFYSVYNDVTMKNGNEFYKLLHDIEQKNKREYIDDEVYSFTKKRCISS